MVGTLICRNCDTAIEVSEGDVARFQANPTFDCPVCHQSLSQRMVDLIGGSPLLRTEPQEEFTQPDDQEAFQGLPVGGSFDEAASKLKNARPGRAPRKGARAAAAAAPAPAAAPPPAPAEDPSTLALRLAAQATAHAEALARGGAVEPPAEAPTGVVSAWHPPNGRSTDAGVVPEEPDNEPTARGGPEAADHTETTEPTMPALAPPNEEATPVVMTSGGAALPQAPINEATPALNHPRRPEPTPAVDRPVMDEPVPEVTIRKTAPPLRLTTPPIRTMPPRTGTGPAGIGALGIRVVQTRSVVRPSFNGRAAPMPASQGDTQISGSHAAVRDRPSGSMAALTPERPARAGSRPRWLYFGVGVLGLVIVGSAVGLAVSHSRGGAATPFPTPPTVDLTNTPIASESLSAFPTARANHPTPLPTEPVMAPVTRAIPTPTAIVVATSRALPTATAAATRTLPIATPVVVATTAPIPTHTATVAATPTPTKVAIAPTPKPTPRPGADWRARIESAEAKYEAGDKDGAMTDVFYVHKYALGEEPQLQAFLKAFKFGFRKEAHEWGEEFLAKFPTSPHAAQVKSQLALAPP